MSQKTCKNCLAQFEVTNDDLKFYDKISPIFSGKKYNIPEPTFCPDCRQQRRLSFRNERNLYHRTCDLSGKKIISIYSEEAKFPVYEQSEWWSDKWDATEYGRGFDFSKSFFEQFLALGKKVPRISLNNSNSVNSEYTNHAEGNKNCYMCVNTGYSDDCMYCSHYCIRNKNCIDCTGIWDCELCWGCIDTKKSYRSTDLFQCSDVSNSSFLYDCKNCTDCFLSWNLRGKQYCIFNVQYSKEEYFKKKKEISFSLGKKLFLQEVISKKSIRISFQGNKNEDCTEGDNIFSSRNTNRSFFVTNMNDTRYCFDSSGIQDGIDCTELYDGELQYETHACNDGYHLISCSKCYHIQNSFYAQECMNSKNIFGCVSLKNSQYCILNKQYSKEEYEKLVPKIIEHMQKTGEWGEFFPSEISPFAYNETVAQEYFPMTKEEVLQKKMKWKEEKTSQDYMGPKVEIPDDIAEVDSSICQKILQCEVTEKLYKITPQELKFYKQMSLPIPRKCPDQRHKERMELRNPRKLFSRECDNCQAEISTTYAPERPEKVFCEKCYLESVY